MCRLYGLRANELTAIDCGLIVAQNALLAQSDCPANGWGLATYVDASDPLYRIPDIQRRTAGVRPVRLSPAAGHPYARTVLAHLRCGTVGAISTLNTHPFSFDGWTFAHTGTIPAFDRLAPQLMCETGHYQRCRLGDTDSEQLFLWLLGRLERDGVNIQVPRVDEVAGVLAKSLRQLEQRCRAVEHDCVPELTFILTNGRVMIGCAWESPLNWVVRERLRKCEICGAFHVQHEAQTEYRALAMASAPITNEAWQRMPDRSLLAVDEAIHSEIIDLSTGVHR